MKTLRLKVFSTVLGLLTIGFNDAKKPVDPVWHDILYNQIIPNSFLADYKPFGADKEWLQPYYEKIYTDPKYYPKNYEPKLGLEEDEESLIQCYKQNQKDQETRQKVWRIIIQKIITH